jgi:hypothetical protein
MHDTIKIAVRLFGFCPIDISVILGRYHFAVESLKITSISGDSWTCHRLP